MRLRLPVLLALVGLCGLLPHAGPDGVLRQGATDPWSVVMHVVVPIGLAIVLAILWPFLSWPRSVLALAGCLMLAQIVRLVLFALPRGLQQISHRLLVDSKDQFLLALSLALQMGSGLLAFAAVRFFVRRAAQRAAAADASRVPHR